MDDKLKKMKSVHEFKVQGLFGHNVLWIASQSKLLILGGIKGFMFHSNAILSCDITSSEQETFLWENYNNNGNDIQLPLGLCYFGCIVYNDIVVIFGGEKEGSAETDTIWCLDTMNTKNGWIRSNVQCPKKGRFYAVCSKKKNKVHLFEMGDNGHWQIDIDKIIPRAMVQNEIVNNDKGNKDNNDDKVKLLETKLAHLDDLYLTLMEDHKILQQEYERQAHELRTFREKYGFNEKNYQIWNSDQIVDWINSLEWPRYCKYEFNLRINLKKENVDGKILDALNRTDWTRFGINDIKDKIDLEKHLTKLIPNYKVAQQNYDNDDNVELEQEEGQQTGNI